LNYAVIAGKVIKDYYYYYFTGDGSAVFWNYCNTNAGLSEVINNILFYPSHLLYESPAEQ
jgi:hypothetical protein